MKHNVDGWSGSSAKEAAARAALYHLTMAKMQEVGAPRGVAREASDRFVRATTRSDVYRLLNLFGFVWTRERWAEPSPMQKAG